MYPALSCPGFMSSTQVWSGPLTRGDYVVLVLNRFDHDIRNVTFDWRTDAKIPSGLYSITDLWTADSLGNVNTAEVTTWTLPSLGFHDNWVVRLKPVLP